MSLAVLSSSPVTYSSQATPFPAGPGPAKRPKLSLNTTNVSPVFGKNATSLRLETLSATSPTVRNTFSNTLSPHTTSTPPKPKRPTLTPLSTSMSTFEQPPTPSIETSTPVLTPSDSISTTTITPATSEAPYVLPFDVKSILVNGPTTLGHSKRFPWTRLKPTSPPKKVSFRAPLTEEVQNIRFTLRHSDIDTSSTEEESKAESSTEEGDDQSKTDGEQNNDDLECWKPAQGPTVRTAPEVTSPRSGNKKRDSSDEEDEDSDVCPATPVAGRRKRHRQWRWTLDPVSPASPVKAKVEQKEQAVSVGVEIELKDERRDSGL